MTVAIVVLIVVAPLATLAGLAVAAIRSHVTDTAEYEDDEDTPLTEWFDCPDEDTARAERAGEFAEAIVAAMQRIEARQGPGRHRAIRRQELWRERLGQDDHYEHRCSDRCPTTFDEIPGPVCQGRRGEPITLGVAR